MKRVKPLSFYKPLYIFPYEYKILKEKRDKEAVRKDILRLLKEDWGPRCKTKDYDDFPDLDPIFAVGDPDASRCGCCLAYEKFDKFWDYFTKYDEPQESDKRS